MAKVNNLKRLVKEEFESDDQVLIEKISFSLNPLFEQLTSAFNKGIDFDNLNQQFSFLDVEVNNLGIPKVETELKYTLRTRLKGAQVISVQNLTDTTFPTGAPFISYTVKANGVLGIDHVTGLPADKRFRLSIVLIG